MSSSAASRANAAAAAAAATTNNTNLANRPVEFNEVNCLEYGLLKIPYEALNKRFRSTQRTIAQYGEEKELQQNKTFLQALKGVEARIQSKEPPVSEEEVRTRRG